MKTRRKVEIEKEKLESRILGKYKKEKEIDSKDLEETEQTIEMIDRGLIQVNLNQWPKIMLSITNNGRNMLLRYREKYQNKRR